MVLTVRWFDAGLLLLFISLQEEGGILTGRKASCPGSG